MTELPEYASDALENLRKYKTNGPQYSIEQGELYQNLRSDVNVDAVEAMEVSRLLNQGDIDAVEKELEELLGWEE